MPKFVTNIHLQNADEKDYETLHKELEKESFKSESHAAKSIAYITESNSFSKEGNITLQEVTNAVLRVFSRIGRKYSFFIIRDKHISHSNQ